MFHFSNLPKTISCEYTILYIQFLFSISLKFLLFIIFICYKSTLVWFPAVDCYCGVVNFKNSK